MSESANVERINIDLGETYLNIVAKAIQLGLANNRSEAIRQAIRAYEQIVEREEEKILLKRGIDKAMEEIKSGKAKTYSLDDLKKEF